MKSSSELNKEAKEIFRKQWIHSGMNITHDSFVKSFRTLYNTQIIPSIVQQLEKIELLKMTINGYEILRKNESK